MYHIDAYRLDGANIEIGLDEYIEGDGVAFIEWPQYIEPLIPESHLDITLSNVGGDNRKIVIECGSADFSRLFEGLKGLSL